MATDLATISILLVMLFINCSRSFCTRFTCFYSRNRCVFGFRGLLFRVCDIRCGLPELKWYFLDICSFHIFFYVIATVLRKHVVTDILNLTCTYTFREMSNFAASLLIFELKVHFGLLLFAGIVNSMWRFSVKAVFPKVNLKWMKWC